jgi:hypothetical protein
LPSKTCTSSSTVKNTFATLTTNTFDTEWAITGFSTRSFSKTNLRSIATLTAAAFA